MAVSAGLITRVRDKSFELHRIMIRYHTGSQRRTLSSGLSSSRHFPWRHSSSYLQHQGRWVHMDLSKFSSTVQAAPFVYRHDTDSARWLTRIREVIGCATYHAHTTAHTLNSLAVPASVRDPSATNGPVAGLSTVSGSASSTHDDDDDDKSTQGLVPTFPQHHVTKASGDLTICV
ncbi:hypothetical protein B0H14DRAFT_2574753 [Mycena olivaceomarginata]|nr:hypothetical protein B0H14DRAFT_2574753 [Mycena olivaceomarginata]